MIVKLPAAPGVSEKVAEGATAKHTAIPVTPESEAVKYKFVPSKLVGDCSQIAPGEVI